MTRSFGLVDYKVQEAEFFMLELERVSEEMNFRGVQFCASAFAAAARSVTFAMQASLNGHPQFKEWYGKRQADLRNDPLAKFFHQFRTVTQHIGESVVGHGSYRKGCSTYYFVPCPDLPSVPEEDVVTACETYFVRILELVYDCYIDLGPIVDGQQHFTKENFGALGKTVEDAEEELGLPRGWTHSGDPDMEPYRWQALRRQADGCLIEAQFERWLKKYLPRPDPLPGTRTGASAMIWLDIETERPKPDPVPPSDKH